MDLPSISKKYITLPEASTDVHVIKLEFSNLIFVIVSTNGKLGDMVQNVLFERQTPNVPEMILPREAGTYESHMLIGCDRDEAHLLAKKIATELKTDKKVIVSSTLGRPISYTDAGELCKALVSP
ncbi:expressed conserved protein [Echinococcus multilocularis]|uniref:Expressed conserved protein n=1 Tax=Echinococcus multilocularis TaxID=6211 RepID=A0A068Y9J4_ECHMU|nr:expressed conserved protein [Echinococcus multilocularis]